VGDLVPLLIALGLALLLTPVAGWIGARAGLVDRPASPGAVGGLKIHERPIPVLGGAAVVVAVVGSLLLSGIGSPWTIAAIAVAFGTGLIDDVRPLAALPRVILLGAAGVLLAANGQLETLLGPLAFPLIVLLALACTNGVNLIDGQDGLAGGVAGAGAVGLAAVAFAAGDGTTAEFGLGVAGAVLGFLFWNRPPARIFLGNGGAYAVGVSLAALATGVVDAGGWAGVAAAVMCLAVPAFELVFTVARRVAAHASLTAGDRNHSYDLVALQTGSRRRSTALFLAAAIVLAAGGAAAFTAPIAVGVATIVVTAAGAVMWGTRLWAERARAPMKGVSP
jgi:UDP-GlcNAc:undecaprenyl-phosphate/decaprenyl-phosphate GlcNAc-1-phosphate transferase